MSEKDTAGVIAPPPLIVGVPLVLGLAAHLHGLGWDVKQLIVSWPLRALGGSTVVVIGALLIVLAMLKFRRADTPPEPWKPTQAVVTSGVYRITRNPMYVGMLLIFAGIAFLAGCLLLAALLVPVALTLHFGVVKREEAYLSAKFGEPYREYLKRGRRWI